MQPDKKFVVGNVSVSIWQNRRETPEGEREFPSLTMQRSFKDKEGNWQNTNSLNKGDLPKAILAMQKAYEHLSLKQPGLLCPEAK